MSESLGSSSDDDPNVQIEMRAAELVVTCWDDLTPSEKAGYDLWICDDGDDSDTPFDYTKDEPEWQAGWLAHHILNDKLMDGDWT